MGEEEDGREMVETGHVVMRMQVDSSSGKGRLTGMGILEAARRSCRSCAWAGLSLEKGGGGEGRSIEEKEPSALVLQCYLVRYRYFQNRSWKLPLASTHTP